MQQFLNLFISAYNVKTFCLEKSIDEKSKSFTRKDAFDGSRKDINAAIDRICEFTGKKKFPFCLVYFLVKQS
jgi:hypothetical protein